MAGKSYNFRVDSTTLNKLHVIASYDLRSVNTLLLLLAREAIEKFEAEHGEIEIGKK